MAHDLTLTVTHCTCLGQLRDIKKTKFWASGFKDELAHLGKCAWENGIDANPANIAGVW